MTTVTEQLAETWHDVDPVPLEHDESIAAIAYAPEFRLAMDYFRAVAESGETSLRALRLTETCLAYNSANYAVWHVRRNILDALVSQRQDDDLYRDELAFVDRTAQCQSKNYQLWHHRREIVSRCRCHDGVEELDWSARLLLDDGKNYHSWAHRQWSVRRFGLWDDDLAFVTRMIERDCRNNSAWNQRYFILTCRPDAALASTEWKRRLSRDALSEELAFTLKQIACCPNNESAWNYLRGLVRWEKLEDFPELERAMDTLVEERPKTRTCVYRLSFLVDVYAESGSADRLNQAEGYLRQLANDLDPIRQSYWNLRLTQLRRTPGQ